MAEATDEEILEWAKRVEVLVPELREVCAGSQTGQAVAALLELAIQLCDGAGMSKADFLIKVTEQWERREEIIAAAAEAARTEALEVARGH